MSVKNGIGYSPLTDKVYLGKQNTEKRLWVGDKKDITNEFLAVEYQENDQMVKLTMLSIFGGVMYVRAK